MALHKAKHIVLSIGAILCMYGCLFVSCRHKPVLPNYIGSGYPDQVSAIMLTKCAVSGCHNSISYEGAAGLNLETWENLFKGAGTGSVVIPYRPDFSSMCYFLNTYKDLGITLEPSMPLNQTPLTREEYLLFKNWIASGAPDRNGNIKFSDDPTRKKIYVINRLCDVVTVFDSETLLQMRYVTVGNKEASEFPYCIKISPDKKYWYVSFFAQSDIVQKFSAENDQLVGSLNLGTGSWTSFAITSDSKHGYFVDNSSTGRIVYADLENLSIIASYDFNGKLQYPIGIALDEELKKIYLGTISGNFLYKIDISDPVNPILYGMPIDGTATVDMQPALDPAELLPDPATHMCYVACTRSKEIRALDMRMDAVIAAIPLNTAPAYMSLSKSVNKLFVTCPDDTMSFAGNRGLVAVIDIHTNSVYKRILSGYQPYGIAVDDERKMVAVVNANISSGGPASHHVSGCGQKNGNVTFIDLNTLSLIPGIKREVAVYPFGAAVR